MSSKGSTLLTAVLWSVVLMIPTVSGAPLLCPHHFGQQVKKCLEPYWSVAALVNSDRPRHSVNDAQAKDLCL